MLNKLKQYKFQQLELFGITQKILSAGQIKELVKSEMARQKLTVYSLAFLCNENYGSLYDQLKGKANVSHKVANYFGYSRMGYPRSKKGLWYEYTG